MNSIHDKRRKKEKGSGKATAFLFLFSLPPTATAAAMAGTTAHATEAAAKAAAATPEQIELDTRNAYDSLLLAGRAMQNAWKSVKPQLAKLPPDTRAGAINQLTSTLTEIQTEAIKCL